jgi:hypothetical protein
VGHGKTTRLSQIVSTVFRCLTQLSVLAIHGSPKQRTGKRINAVALEMVTKAYDKQKRERIKGRK